MSYARDADELMYENFRLHTARMNLGEDVDLEEFVTAKDDLSGADIKAVCTEAGLLALRERRMRVTKADFTSAREKVCSFQVRVTFPSVDCFDLGVVQEERRNARRSLPMICASILFCFYDILSAIILRFHPLQNKRTFYRL